MCCQRRARDACVYDTDACGRDGLERELKLWLAIGEDDKTGMERDVNALRRLPILASSRGGVPIGEFEGRLYKPRCGTAVSSSKVRLSVERAEIVVFPLIFTGIGERDNGDICMAVAPLGSGNRMGRAGEASVDVLDDMADAETGVVCGSLRPLRNGLKNQDGANLDVNELREELASRRCSPLVDVAVDIERFERTERIDDCDGDVLRVVAFDFGVLCNMLTGRDGSPESSEGNSVMTRLGLSSIGAILFDMMELRWVAMVRLSIIDW